MKKITSFRNEYRFLSNFYPSKIHYKGITFPTVEHFYQAMKSNNKSDWIKISKLETPGKSKRAGRKLTLRKNWDVLKRSFMIWALKEKFNNNDFKLKDMLIETKDFELIEGNTWHNNIWGNCYCKRCIRIEGENLLGKFLMKVRDEIIIAASM